MKKGARNFKIHHQRPTTIVGCKQKQTQTHILSLLYIVYFPKPKSEAGKATSNLSKAPQKTQREEGSQYDSGAKCPAMRNNNNNNVKSANITGNTNLDDNVWRTGRETACESFFGFRIVASSLTSKQVNCVIAHRCSIIIM